LSGHPDNMAETDDKVRALVDINITGDWSTDPLTAIEKLTAGVEAIESALQRTVRLAREQGRTWEEIGKALGVSRQSAWERFSTD
jgi:hypothetical protein